MKISDVPTGLETFPNTIYVPSNLNVAMPSFLERLIF